MASRTEDLAFMDDLADRVIEAVKNQIPVIRFGRLRDSLGKFVTEERISIFSYYYWFGVVNQGRGVVSPRRSKYLVWFADPKKDPRIAGDYPRKPSAVKSLREVMDTRTFRAMVKSGEILVRKASGPASGYSFLQNGIREARKTVPKEMRAYVKKNLREAIKESTRAGRTRVTLNL